MAKPAFCCQVTIQSEKEKQMMKIYRREEKKEKKKAKGTDDIDSSEVVMTFDPKEMRAQRYIISKLSLSLLCCLCSLSIHLCLCSKESATNKTSFCIFHDTTAALQKSI
ncbi:hypothetical protein AMECASPLE_014482 [Ameca splendens]|uniref:Uncharacterized protein n=1 Tax=Ameca splendens TaxID=208324 RepID=A0ABV0YDM3_9TELE